MRIIITAELMTCGMGSFAELMPGGMGSFSEGLCHFARVRVCLAYAFWHRSVQYDAICPVVSFEILPKLTPCLCTFHAGGSKVQP